MIKFLGILTALVLTDFFFFPFEPAFLPGINVKTILAGLSLPYIGFLLAKKRNAAINNDIITIFLFTIPITLFSWITNIYNDTYDYSFNYYFISVFVWMGAAFVVVSFIKTIHQKLDVQLVANYLISVCCLQCILALCMEYNPTLMNFINGMMAESASAFMGNAGNRMHGLGCALDVAGGRFAAVLLMVAFLLSKSKSKIEIYFYIISFLIITVIGNMIGRTTTVGVVLSIIYWIYDILKGGTTSKIYWQYLAGGLMLLIPVIIVLYQTNNVFYENLRFGFEGFFSLAERGKWETSSTDILSEHMIVFPDNIKTWLIGDGYGANPSNDPYYTGKSYHGFYMGTDIGYLRFIFFFGLFGMCSMIVLFIHFWSICCKRFPYLKEMITLLLLLNLIIWFKVTSDLLPIFTILLCIDKEKNETSELY